MSDGKVRILVDVDGRQVKVLQDELDRVTQKGQQGSRSLKDFASGSLIFKAVSAGVNLLNQSLDKAISCYDTLQRFPRVMKAMGHSTDDVTVATEKLANGIDGLPTTLDEVVGTAQQLTSITGNLRKSTDLTLALNNAFLASGSSSADASRGLQQYTQMLSAGKVDMQSWKTLQETMPYALQKTAESFGFAGKSAQRDFYAALQSGQVTFDQFSAKLVELNGGVGGFAEMTRKNSEGIATSFGNLRNAIAKGLANLLESFDKLSKAVTGKSIAQNIDRTKVVINSAFKVISASVAASAPFFKVFFNTVKTGIGVVKPFLPLLAAMTTAFLAMKVVASITALLKTYSIAVTVMNAAVELSTTGQVVNAAAFLAQQGVLKGGAVIYGLLTGKLTLMTAAQIAGSAATGIWTAAVMAFNAAWLANPIGIVVGAIAGLIVAGTALWHWLNQDSEETKQLKKEQEDLVSKTNDLTKAIKQNAKARKDAVKENADSAESYKKLADEIIELSTVENKTAADKKNLEKKIQTLNGAVDGLNLAYDKNTDSLSHNTEQLQARIGVMEAEMQWQTAQENLMSIEQDRVDINKQLTDISQQRKEVTENMGISDRQRAQMLGELKTKEDELNASLVKNQAEHTRTAEAQVAAAEVLAAAAENGANRQVIAYENMSQSQQSAIDSMRQRFQELADTTTSMFDAIEQKTALSVEQINANLEANRAATEQWASNLEVLAQRGVDQGILEQLRQLGPEGAAQTQVFVDASAEEMAVLEENFRKTGEAAKNAINSEISSMGQEVPQGVRDLVTNISSGLQAELANANFAEFGSQAGQDTVDGFSKGIDGSSSKSAGSARKMAELIKNDFKEDLGIHSPSRVFMEYGGHVATGLANGIAKNASTPVGKVTALATQMKTPFQGLPSVFMGVGVMSMQGFAAGIHAGSGAVLAAAASVAGQVTSTIKRALDIHSPSRVMRDEVGRYVPQGIAVGIEADQDVIARSMEKLKASMIITSPEKSLGLDKSLATQVNLKQVTSQTFSERFGGARERASLLVDKALEVAEEAIKRPVYLTLDDGTLVARLGEPMTQYQSQKLFVDNLMKGVIP